MINHILETMVTWVWYWPVVALCTISGIYFSFRLGFVQFRSIPHAIQLLRGKFDDPNEVGQISHFQALASALSGTIGLGNIAGVAIAIGMGGPGAILWMWILGLLGMATKYVECTLGTHFRDVNKETGEVRGGPMYYIDKGLGKRFKPLAIFYAACIFMGAFGAGNMFQTNQAASSLHNSFGVETWITGLILALLVGSVIIGGIKRIGSVASKIVPLMCGIYLLGAITICVMNIHLLPDVVRIIITDAFSGSAAAGGAIGTVIIWGVRRAVFSNEAGLGSASIAHAAVKTKYPVREGIVASLGPVIDTVIVCTATACIIIISGQYGTERHYAQDTVAITQQVSTLANAWSIDETAPQIKNKLRQFKTSPKALQFNNLNSPTAQNAITVSPIPVKNSSIGNQDGLRLSYYKAQGNFKIEVIDNFNTVHGHVNLETGETDGEITFEGYIQNNEWSSLNLYFSDALKEKINITTEDIHFQVRLTPLGQAKWYFDRFQSIQKRQGISVTTQAFDTFFTGFGSIFVSIAVFFFAFSTLITWYYYGETALEYLKGHKFVLAYKGLFVIVAFLGATNPLRTALNFSDLTVGLMVIPNMIGLILLAPLVNKWTKEYFSQLKNGTIKPFK